MTKIKEICTVISGSTPKTNVDEYWDGDIKWITPAELNEDSFYLYDSVRHITELGKEKAGLSYMPKGTVILSSRAPIGKVAIAGCEMCCNQGFKNLICSDAISNEYLYYFLKSKTDYLNSLGRGATFKELSKSIVENIEIKVPSLDKQREIAGVLGKVYELVNLRRQQIVKLDELVKARFVELFGIPIDNTKNWPMDKAENLCTLVTDGSHFSPKACDEGYPMLSVKDMRQNGFDYSDCKLVDDETFEILKKQGCVPQVDDVLIAKDGSYFTRAFAISEYKDQAILSSIGMYRPDKDKILPRFLASYLMTNEVIEFVNRGYVTGTALRRVIIKGLKNIPVYMPPLELQKEFVQFAEQTDKSKLAVQQSLGELEMLKRALMQKYFG